MIYTWKLNFALLLSHFLVNLSTRKVVSMLFSQHRWTCVDSTSLFNLIPTLKQTLGHQHWINVTINVASTLFCQNWNHVDKHTLAQLSFSTKYQRETTSMNVDDQHWFNVDVFAGNKPLFYQIRKSYCFCVKLQKTIEIASIKTSEVFIFKIWKDKINSSLNYFDRLKCFNKSLIFMHLLLVWENIS